MNDIPKILLEDKYFQNAAWGIFEIVPEGNAKGNFE